MVEVVLPRDIQKRLQAALETAGDREIGGVLMGECLAPNRFRVADLTIQRHGGSLASFVRRLGEAIAALKHFFRQTREEYTRFNYLGEWHSHPSFSVTPSTMDVRSMRSLACDPEVGANFVALLILRLRAGRIAGSGSVYWPDGALEEATLSMEGSCA